MALLSLVVPAHGVDAYLPACLNSILREAPDGGQVQVVGVDDGSPDRCGAILDGYARQDARLRVLHLRPNRGLGPARNAGLEAATGEYVWFVDGDDALAPGAVRAVLDRLREARPDVLLLRHAWLVDDRVRPDRDAARVPRSPQVLNLTQRPSLLRVRQAAWNRVVRRDLLDRPALRFPAGWYEDVSFSHFALVAADRVATLPDVTYLYRRRRGAITSTLSPRHFEVFAQYERLFAALDAVSASSRVRTELFERMLEHYLVIVGTDRRVPDAMRPAFFGKIVDHYHRYLPAEGYEAPRGLSGLKLRFIKWDTYSLFRIFRAGFRGGRRASATIDRRCRAVLNRISPTGG